ncbi:hypothetical protein [Janthinobacterium sp. SUN137]|uniref:hypothetical protein n=1 Tax=Janthinobacterium sp. SUN137 TaxID=3014789 RepID=UPI0027130988|nr:hypothetical protein [Janthinobacterium sp. SUN137]MDO8039448.1 hypothetical protein [Janthinobacterium sp. SUN137]
MKKFPWLVVCITLVLSVSFSLPMAGLIFALQGDERIANANVAAWTQGLASVITLIAAVGIAYQQSVVQRRAKRDSELRETMQASRLAAVASRRAFNAAENFIDKVREWPDSSGGFKYCSNDIGESKELLSMAVSKINHSDLIEPLFDMHRTLVAVEQKYRDLQGYVYPMRNLSVAGDLEKWATELREAASVIDDIATGAVAALTRFERGGI